ncbi:hypothetical protein CKO_01998 [Citrobacter koseri ATCC BAA-895]|uniref:Uncharacterized protein n=1 Tax=Citrobacter koseri (strain ATCC BAA-895 / CDC 4225-83 / SGSC4696) TaxID=290338 RepID=A8AI10_CITK8|nr:hypothetical protein CKO_01998 [Citrobacter koseri ATCC BAA-895]
MEISGNTTKKPNTTSILSMSRKYLPRFLACETRDISPPGKDTRHPSRRRRVGGVRAPRPRISVRFQGVTRLPPSCNSNSVEFKR